MDSSIHVMARNAIKAAIRAKHRDLVSWRKVGVFYGVNQTTCYRSGMEEDYEPKDELIREKLGFPPLNQIEKIEITFANGRIVKVEVPRD